MGTCGMCGLIGVWRGGGSPRGGAVGTGAAAVGPTGFGWLGLSLGGLVLAARLGARLLYTSGGGCE